MIEPLYDLAIIGGGINGCGVARDAAGRGLSVFLCEQNDLASGTSSASTKLIHGGLRYLEYFEFRLVREALREREVLLRMAPHIIWPLRFVLPHHQGIRPAWLLRFGLFIYDHLGGRELLPGTTCVNLRTDETGKPLKESYRKGFEYSDCWVIDSRLVVLNAMDAADRGAEIRTRCKCIGAERSSGPWELRLKNTDSGETSSIRARALVNASGPWLEQVIDTISHERMGEGLRMVKGSHIIIKKLFDHGKAYIFQNEDGRIIFAIPYENNFTLIGTTDVDFTGEIDTVKVDREEIEYLTAAASEYFRKEVTPEDMVHSFSGVRPLFDDGAGDAKSATRDYTLKLDAGADGVQAPLLSIFGGKITTYRKLAQSVISRLEPFLSCTGEADWTEMSCLPGGYFDPGEFENKVEQLKQRFHFLDDVFADRLLRTYGTLAFAMLDGTSSREDLGTCFGADLYEKEVEYLVAREWAQTADDILWRRTSLGLLLSKEQKQFLGSWLEEQRVRGNAVDRKGWAGSNGERNAKEE